MAKSPGSFKPGHQLWRNRKDPVKPLRFKTPDALREECIGYLDWCVENPFQEEKIFHFQGDTVKGKVDKLRMPTIDGMCVYLGIHRDTWYSYGKRPKFKPVVDWVSAVMYDYKLSGAAAGVLDSHLIGRHLGIADKHDYSSTDGTMSPPKVIKMVPKKA